MEKSKIEKIVVETIKMFCDCYGINADINMETQLIGSDKVLDSMGLVSVIVDIETAFLDENIELSLTSEAAMSARISPFRTVNSLCNFIESQIKMIGNE
jgi:acyl carrier protein